MNVLDAALYTKLSGSTALTSLLGGTAEIYSVSASEQAVFPYVVFSVQGGGDDNLDARRTKNLVYFIRAYSKVTKAEAGTIDAVLDTVLHGQSISPSGWNNYWLAREEDLESVEYPPSNQPIHMVGGFYRLLMDK